MKGEMPAINRHRCPACAKCEGVPLIFGFPREEDFERQERGEVILAGCVAASDSDMQCRNCDFQWSSVRGPVEKTERDTVDTATIRVRSNESLQPVSEPTVRDAAGARLSATHPRRPDSKVSFIPTVAVFVVAMITTSLLFGAVACSDGWTSASTGRSGACSHHGGVDHLLGMLRLLFSLFSAWRFHLWRMNRAGTP